MQFSRFVSFGASWLGLCAGAALAQAPETYEGATYAGSNAILSSSTFDAGIGSAVHVVGDLNADGVRDLIVQTTNGTYAQARDGATGAILYFMTDGIPADHSRAVVPMPDLTGDGVPDYVTGSPRMNNYGPGGSGTAYGVAGRVELRSGATGAVVWSVSGTGNDIGLGATLTALDDLTGDGVAEIGASAPGYAPFVGSPPSGYALVLNGATGAILQTLPAPGGFSLGRGFARIGDVDFDGVDDYVLTASATAVGPYACATPALAAVVSGSSGEPLSVVEGPLCDAFGFTAAAIGDATGDGVPDFAIGAPDNITAPMTGGVVTLHSGATAAVYATLVGPVASAAFGRTMVGEFDFDGDGDLDLAVGAPQRLTSAGSPGAVYVFDAGTGALIATVPGVAGATRFGFGLAAADDRTGDGVVDLVIGAPDALVGGVAKGVYTVRSRYGLATGGVVFDAGCSGSLAAAPWLGFFGGGPAATLGNPAFGLAATKGPANGAATLVVGVSNTAWFGGALPYPLASLGFGAACSLLTAPDLVVFGGYSAAGTALFPFPLAPTPALAGVTLFAQTLAFAPGAPLGGGASAGLAVTLQ
jgi:hypothetical protein